VDFFERRDIPFVVAVNCFDDARRFEPAHIATALDLEPRTPVLLCDARERASSKEVLITLVEHASRLHTARRRSLGHAAGSPAGA
jgi:signal recognition particle receptor subunit beta